MTFTFKLNLDRVKLNQHANLPSNYVKDHIRSRVIPHMRHTLDQQLYLDHYRFNPSHWLCACCYKCKYCTVL